MTQPLRLICDPPGEGTWNMAVDEALLASAAESGSSVLRFYSWHPATVSIGYFQSFADRSRHSASSHCPLVRRSTGGGAIVHDRELTYSLCLPNQAEVRPGGDQLYDTIHHALIQAIESLLPAASGELRLIKDLHQPEQSATSESSPFLCFQRRSPADVVWGEHKLIGSAQRRRAGCVLQHGSVLLGRSDAAPELPGLLELARHLDVSHQSADQPDLRSFQAALEQASAAKIGAALSLEIEPSTITDGERAAAQSWLDQRYGDAAFIQRR